MTPSVISVAIADDQALIRAGFRMILQEAPGFTVVGEAADGAAAADLAARTRPDVILMDIRMPVLDGIEATRRIRAAAGPDPVPRILILTTFDLDEYVYTALKAGASGFLLKDTLAADLLAAIRTVQAGDAVTSPAITRRLIEHYTAGPGPGSAQEASADRLAPLTPREREVLTLIAAGMSNTEIAATLVLSEGTVKTHVGRILAKLRLRDRVHAVITGYQAGLAGTAHQGSGPTPDNPGTRLRLRSRRLRRSKPPGRVPPHAARALACTVSRQVHGRDKRGTWRGSGGARDFLQQRAVPATRRGC